MSKKSQQVAILCGLAVAAAATAYLLISRTKKGGGSGDAFNPAALKSCKSEGEESVTVRTRNPPIPVGEEGLGAKLPTSKNRRNNKKVTIRKVRNTSKAHMNLADENQQNVANTPPDADLTAALAAKAAGQALAAAALIAAKKAAKNKQRKKNSRKKKGVAQKAAVKEIQEFQNSQSGKKYSQALSARRQELH